MTTREIEEADGRSDTVKYTVKYTVKEWLNGYALKPTHEQSFEAMDDQEAIRRAKQILRTRGKWPYGSTGEATPDGVFVAGWNLDHPRSGEKTRLGVLTRA